MAILDSLCTFSLAQAVTTTAVSTNVFDAGVARELAVSDIEILIDVDTAFTAAGSATMTIDLQEDSAVGFGTATVVATTGAIPVATLVAGYVIFLSIPRNPAGPRRYYRLNYTVATGPMTAGKITSTMVLESFDLTQKYPANSAIL